jgi:hypothetical protein
MCRRILTCASIKMLAKPSYVCVRFLPGYIRDRKGGVSKTFRRFLFIQKLLTILYSYGNQSSVREYQFVHISNCGICKI